MTVYFFVWPSHVSLAYELYKLNQIKQDRLFVVHQFIFNIKYLECIEYTCMKLYLIKSYVQETYRSIANISKNNIKSQ